MSVHEIKAAEEEAKVYDKANTHMPKDSRKKCASKVLHPPTTLEELLSMLRQYAVFCREIWSRHSNWAHDVSDMLKRLKSNQHMLRMDASTC
jgi:hypothetical protein